MGKNKQNGITLIALVITIIVLLILAGITINLTIGQDGIITKAQQAGKNYIDAANYENQMLKDFESMTDDILTNVTGTNGGAGTPPAPTEVKVTSITLDKTSATITIGNTETLTATIAPSDATNKNLTWTSDNTSVATVSNGVITGVATGTATITAAAQDGSGKTATCSVTVNKTGKLTDIIDASDYGKTINYSANGVTDWKVFYNDGTNVYIIASDYLDNTKIDIAKTGMTITGTHGVYWADGSLASPENKSAVATLTNTDNWSAFVDSSKAQSAIGSPTLDMYVASWNAKGYTRLYTATNDNGYYIGTSANPSSYNINMSSDAEGYADKLYYSHTSVYSNCNGYWLASPSAAGTNYVMYVNCNGYVSSDNNHYGNIMGIRPVVCLQAGITGTVGTSVSMD